MIRTTVDERMERAQERVSVTGAVECSEGLSSDNWYKSNPWSVNSNPLYSNPCHVCVWRSLYVSLCGGAFMCLCVEEP